MASYPYNSQVIANLMAQQQAYITATQAYVNGYMPVPMPPQNQKRKDKNIREEMQEDVNAWLKDVV